MHWDGCSNAEADQVELEAHPRDRWTRDIINKTAEEVAPRQLATIAAEYIKSVAPAAVKAKIVKDKDLLTSRRLGRHLRSRRGSWAICNASAGLQPNGRWKTHPCLLVWLVKVSLSTPAVTASSRSVNIGNESWYGWRSDYYRWFRSSDWTRPEQAYQAYPMLCREHDLWSCLEAWRHRTYKNGKTVEIMNTDAEGRLVLADGLMFASAQVPELIIDCTTLTEARLKMH